MSFVHRSFRSFQKITYLARSQYISMSSKLRENALESLKSNPYFDKYSNKIFEKQKVSPEEFFCRLEEHEKQKRIAKAPKTEDLERNLDPGEAKSNVAERLSSENTLDKIMKIDLISDKNAAEIQRIWEEFHKSKDSTVSATLPAKTFKLMLRKSREHPVFLLPLPRNQGYEFIMLQFAGNEIHFTPLISYQTHKENAPECLTIALYPELIEEKNIVLMKGEFDKNVINAMEAQCLANQLQLFYGENNEKRNRLMDRFTHYPHDFKHMDLIAEIESLSF